MAKTPNQKNVQKPVAVGGAETLPHLFRPFSQRSVTLRNRVVVSPMCQYRAIAGAVTDWHYQHHARFALGGVGVACVEATAVAPEGRITAGCTGLWDDAQIPGLARIVAMYVEHGVVPAIQIGHAGRKASTARPWDGAHPLGPADADAPWPTIAPSAVAVGEGWHVPREMTRDDIARVLSDFREAAARARKAGFQIIEIHGAHGYLIHEFFSPISNQRTDSYGGTRENRMRFALEVVAAVRDEWPDDLPLWYRTSVVDGGGDGGGGVVVEDTVALARELGKRGVDLIDCSSGGLAENATLRRKHPGAGFQVPYAEAVRSQADIATMAVGFITEPAQAEAIIADGRADLVAIARELLTDPNWAFHAALQLGHPDAYQMLPPAYGFYLERRAKLES